jgi:hypothetical protein
MLMPYISALGYAYAVVTEKKIADLFNIKSRFLRSAHLERDFNDSAALAGYVRTDFIEECCDRIGEGLRPKSGRRAWRVTGDYGSGKSSFALLVANALAGRDTKLPPHLVRVFDFKKLGVAQPELLPVLVTCSRQSLSNRHRSRPRNRRNAVALRLPVDQSDGPLDILLMTAAVW